MDETKKNEGKDFNIPYSLIVECENEVRQKMDFWRLRTLAIILRQTPNEIKKFESRYQTPIN